MVIEAFPPLSDADEHGFLAVGGDLEVRSLLLAYSSGIFPWPANARTLAWFSPPKRAVLFLDEFHCAKSLQKAVKKSPFRFGFNKDFKGVITRCAETINRGEQDGTWITKPVISAYTALHEAGFAHSIECYDGTELAGGVYGVSIGGMFAAESMFYRKPNGSKMALMYMRRYLAAQGVEWVDVQVQNPFLKTLGVREIARDKFIRLLTAELGKPRLRFPAPNNTEPLKPLAPI